MYTCIPLLPYLVIWLSSWCSFTQNLKALQQSANWYQAGLNGCLEGGWLNQPRPWKPSLLLPVTLDTHIFYLAGARLKQRPTTKVMDMVSRMKKRSPKTSINLKEANLQHYDANANITCAVCYDCVCINFTPSNEFTVIFSVFLFFWLSLSSFRWCEGGEKGAFWDKFLLKPDTRDLFADLTNITSMFRAELTRI